MDQTQQLHDIRFGDEYEDVITGFKGFVVSKHEYTTGCHQVGLTSKADKEGDYKHHYYDITRLVRKSDGVSKKLAPPKPERGGPAHHPGKE